MNQQKAEASRLSYMHGIGSPRQRLYEARTPVLPNVVGGADEVPSVTVVSNRNASASASSVDVANSIRTAGVVAQVLSGSDDVRTEKVAALRRSIATGMYSVLSSDIAAKLIGALLKPA